MPHGERDVASQAARHELTRIHAHHYPEQGRWKEYYRLVIDCLRRYLAQEFQIETRDRSVAGLRRALRSIPLTPEQKQALLDLFAENEAVQKSQYLPGLDEGRQLTERALAIVEQTARQMIVHFAENVGEWGSTSDSSPQHPHPAEGSRPIDPRSSVTITLLSQDVE